MKPIKTTRRQRRHETASATVRVRPAATMLPTSVEDVLSSSGEPLDAALRGEMESRLGHNFGDVRVHTDARADAAARTLDANAFTRGADIVFAAGRYRPGSEVGRWLIAHELVHTLQQGGAVAPVPQTSGAVVADDDPLEREAAEVAGWIAAGQPVPPGTVTLAAPAVRGRIARKARTGLERIPAEVPDSPDAVRALAGDVVRLLVADPDDGSGRVKRRLARLAPATRAAVTTELAGRIPAPAAARLRAILAELLPRGARVPVTDPFERPTADGHAEPSAEPSAEEAESATAEEEAVGDATEPAPAEIQPGEPDEGMVTGDLAPSPAEVEPGEAEDTPEPAGRVEEPQIAAEVVTPEPDVVPSSVEAQTDGRPAGVGGPAPALDRAEAAGPEEDAADDAPVDETEQEAMEAHDEADAEPADTVDEATARVPEPAPDAGATSAEEEGSEVPTLEGADGGGDPDAPVGDLEGAVPVAPETEAEPEKESVAEKPPEAQEEGDEATSDEQPTAEPMPLDQVADEDLDGAPVDVPTRESEDVEPEEPADATPADEEPTTDEAASVDAGGDEGGAAPIEEPTEPETPDLSGTDPAAAIEAAGTLPPAQSEAALTGVDAAASRSVGAQRAALADQPPALDRPTGAPAREDLETEREEATGPPEAPERLERPAQPPAPTPTRVAPLPPAPPPAAARAPTPQIPGGAQGELSENGRRALQASLGALPVHDPALDISVGPAPAIHLDGAADPQRANDERAKLESAARGALADGRREILKPAGEQHLVPDAPSERLRATIAPAATAPPVTPVPEAAAGAAAATMAAADPASILARHQRGAELRAAAKDAAAGMRARRAEHAVAAAEERQRSQEQVTELVRESAAQQTERRADARREVHDQRRRWSAAEQELAETKLTEADTELGAGVEKVTRLRTDADEKAAAHLETGERQAEKARRDGEEKAAAERSRGQEKASGPLGWLADQATALFDEIKAGITKIFADARAAVREAIEGAKKLAAEATDVARAAIVAAITLAGTELIAIGDTLLEGLPGVRDRFQRAIGDRIAKARTAINELAEGLKRGVQKALDGLGEALDAAVGLLEKGLLLMVEGYRAVLTGALKWANALVTGFAAFAALAKHIAANPKQWLMNLAASAMDGVKNHLWRAFKAAIKGWFSEKVEEVLGLGLSVWNLLKKGGVSLARIGTMAWEAIKAAIPPTLVQILIEKLISLLIPAAAAVMLIIETLQAAWGTIQRVLQAFERFFAFLKAVRTGRAGPQFATAIAAASIAVIDFVANWLLKRLRKPAGKIAKKLKGLAKKLGKKVARLGKGAFTPRRRKPKVKGKPTRKPKPDKHAQAEKRVAAASDFLDQKVARGIYAPVLWAQMKYARVRWRVRISLRAHGNVGALTISANPKKGKKLKKKRSRPRYLAAIGAFQGFLREFHERHHIFTVALRDYWDAFGIRWNDPKNFLDVPAIVHRRALHAKAKLNPKSHGTKSIRAAFRRTLKDNWNHWWQRWLAARFKKWITGPKPRSRNPKQLKKLLDADTQLQAKIRAEVTGSGVNDILKHFTGRSGVDLSKFRTKAFAEREFQKHWNDLSKLAADISKAKTDEQEKKIIIEWQLRLAGGRRRIEAKAKDEWVPE